MSIEILLQLLLPMIGALLIKPKSAAKFAKWLIRIRNYLNLLFPVTVYPEDWTGTNITPSEAYAVPVSAVKDAMKEKGFSVKIADGKR